MADLLANALNNIVRHISNARAWSHRTSFTVAPKWVFTVEDLVLLLGAVIVLKVLNNVLEAVIAYGR
jgi:hypothetical protein